ncbi:MAG: flavodoxin [Nitriliruptor sp.]|nr:MAG: flavodoxin [Nitriliruptor sp.]
MRVLVTAASKHGATSEIADAIADRLAEQGIDVVQRLPADVASPDGFDAVILGSGVYAGRWLDAARQFVARLSAELRDRQVWIFSSGPLGDPLKPEQDPVDAAAMLEATGARDHRVFAGRLDRSLLGFADKAIVVALRAPEGDFRDWDAIHAWADGISRTLGQHGRS